MSGPSSVVQAMASGKQSALSVNRFLAGEGLRWGRDPLGDMSVTQYQVNSAVGLEGERAEPHRLEHQQKEPHLRGGENLYARTGQAGGHALPELRAGF